MTSKCFLIDQSRNSEDWHHSRLVGERLEGFKKMQLFEHESIYIPITMVVVSFPAIHIYRTDGPDQLMTRTCLIMIRTLIQDISK